MIYIIEATFYKDYTCQNIIYHDDLFVTTDKQKALDEFDKLKTGKVSTLYDSNYNIELIEYRDGCHCTNDPDISSWEVLESYDKTDYDYDPSDNGYLNSMC